MNLMVRKSPLLIDDILSVFLADSTLPSCVCCKLDDVVNSIRATFFCKLGLTVAERLEGSSALDIVPEMTAENFDKQKQYFYMAEAPDRICDGIAGIDSVYTVCTAHIGVFFEPIR